MFRKKSQILLALILLAAGISEAQVTIGNLPPANVPLQATDKVIVDQVISGAKSTRQANVSSFTSLAPPISATYLLQSPNGLIPNSRTLTGTANEILLADGGPLGNLVLSTPQPIGTLNTPTFAGMTLTGALGGTSAVFSGALSSVGYSGTSGTFTGALSAPSLTLTTTPLAATSGGTGFASYAVGDLLSASTTTALSRLSDVAAGSYLRSGGISTLPLWSTLTLPNAATTGDLLAATGSNAIGNIVDVAAGSYLRSGGVGVAPVYSTLTLPNAATTGDLLIATGSNAIGNLADVSAGSYLRSNGVGAAPVYSTVKIPNAAATGDLWYGSAASTISALTGNITTTKNFLTQTGSGAASAAPAWGTIAAADLPGSFSGFANPSGLIGMSAVNGVATTADRSDSTHAIDPAIAPTWTGSHLFTGAATSGTGTSGASIGAAAGIPSWKLIASGGAADQKNTQCYYNTSGTLFNCTFLNDANSTEKVFFQAVRGATTAVSTITLGNSTDKPSITLTGATTATSPAIATPALTDSCSSGTFSATANPCMSLVNTNASAQTPIDFFSNTSTLTGRIRNDSAGNFSYVSFSSGSHTFFTGGDSGVGTTRMTIGPSTTVTMPTLVQSSAAQTGTMCWSAANITVDTTVACLTSTIRVKEHIENLDVGLGEVLKLHPVSYDLKPEFNPFHIPGRQVGLIAEQVQKVDPRLVALDDGGQPRGVRYMQLTAVLIKAIQQQQIEIYTLYFLLLASFFFTYIRTR